MKAILGTRRLLVKQVWVYLALWAAAGVVSTASAQTNYSLDWWTIDGGGGTSTGGVYSVSGTIGQPDAGHTMSGGSFTLESGFWGIIGAIQLPGAPHIDINLSSSNSIIISWPAGSTQWQLQQNTNLNGTNWVMVGTAQQQVGAVMQVIVSPPTGARFYRLLSPTGLTHAF
jgi:hypothetical protein